MNYRLYLMLGYLLALFGCGPTQRDMELKRTDVDQLRRLDKELAPERERIAGLVRQCQTLYPKGHLYYDRHSRTSWNERVVNLLKKSKADLKRFEQTAPLEVARLNKALERLNLNLGRSGEGGATIAPADYFTNMAVRRFNPEYYYDVLKRYDEVKNKVKANVPVLEGLLSDFERDNLSCFHTCLALWDYYEAGGKLWLYTGALNMCFAQPSLVDDLNLNGYLMRKQ